jgi:two-component system cell cycle sensor histidine kinase/response regulator CckA
VTTPRAPRPRPPEDTAILVVDDDSMTRALVVRALKTAGYRVWPASGAAEARQVLTQLNGPLDLLLTDVVMPGGMGPELAAEIRKAYPRVRVLYMSIHTRAALTGHGIVVKDQTRLAKPVMPGELLTRNHEIFERESGAGKS